MIEHRRRRDLFSAKGQWFRAAWHFSFENYRDPGHDHLGPLFVLNDDHLAPGAVWPLHPHKDVEGITYVAEGRFRHDDSIGTGGVFDTHLIQRMTLGAGSWHSECNASEDRPMRFVQLWLLPTEADLQPSCEQRQLTAGDLGGGLRCLVAPDGGDGGVAVHADARVSVGLLDPGQQVAHRVTEGRGMYAVVLDGQVRAGDIALATGDAVLVDEPWDEGLAAGQDGAHVLLVDVPLTYQPVGVWTQRRWPHDPRCHDVRPTAG